MAGRRAARRCTACMRRSRTRSSGGRWGAPTRLPQRDESARSGRSRKSSAALQIARRMLGAGVSSCISACPRQSASGSRRQRRATPSRRSLEALDGDRRSRSASDSPRGDPERRCHGRIALVTLLEEDLDSRDAGHLPRLRPRAPDRRSRRSDRNLLRARRHDARARQPRADATIISCRSKGGSTGRRRSDGASGKSVRGAFDASSSPRSRRTTAACSSVRAKASRDASNERSLI